MDLSIIIVSYNTKQLLERCLNSVLKSIKKNSLTYEIIVVDNNSSDGSLDLLNNKYPQVKKILNNSNQGFGKANNQAIKKASGEHILLLNSDCVVHQDAIKQLYMFTVHKEKHQIKAFCGGRLLNEDGTVQASCGPYYWFWNVFLMLFLRGDHCNLTRYSPNQEQEVDWISGACILSKKEYFIAVSGFDEKIFLYMEEIDLLYRAKQQGFRVFYTPSAVFTHTGAASSGSKKEPVVNIFRGLQLLYRKHHSPFEQFILLCMLRLKAWLVIFICGIMNNRELKSLYAKALAALE